MSFDRFHGLPPTPGVPKDPDAAAMQGAATPAEPETALEPQKLSGFLASGD